MIVSTTDEWTKAQIRTFAEVTDEPMHIYTNIEQIPDEVKAETTILITFGNDLTSENVPLFKKLKWIQLLSAGLEDLPFNELRTLNPIITNARGIHTRPMAEYTLGAMLYFEKHFDRFLSLKKKKTWDRDRLVGELIEQKAIVFGTGAIGQSVAASASYFDMVVHGVNTSGKAQDPFDEVFTLEDGLARINDYAYVILVLPLTPDTHGLFSEEVLKRLNDDAVLINVGRGGLVDEDALVDMLTKRKIKGAALDVFIEEPLPKEHPFWELENVLLTHHMSAKSAHYLTRCMDILTKNLTAVRRGASDLELINYVNLTNRY
ncbi:phosphoglycerate dehydrogenase-like enzyme [Salsuginibacillus halophilus]|uniref:Phosphoglycerate dehydrogenase-like enzyme n=1 Tax=Salsuginibacillus halophilus TaxID=517424 RepID=A0A2P8HL93_9BACI|nr:D-2-hydroxyacid dehydrogenase [Salsuginibacillus halophilus]PSL46992.1 phosphoglycerate dehydrogenase-like enzyme [Salsuginibacillus halophilus]